MGRFLIIRALVLTAVFLGTSGCGSKPEDEPSSGGNAPATSGDSDIPAPPRTNRPLTDNWELGEIGRGKRETSNNLRMIGLALHSYHDAYSGLPVGYFDASGKKLGLSWRVAILPYIEQDALFKQFKLDEPWDGPNNKKLIRKMPKLFAVTNTTAPQGYTYYRGFAGDGMFAQFRQQGTPGQVEIGVKFSMVNDGLSNTLMVAEVNDPVIWTKPDEPVVNAKSAVPSLGGVFKDGFHAVMGDSSFRWFKLPMPEATQRNLILRNDGNIVDIP